MKKILGIKLETFEEIKDLFENTEIQEFTLEEGERTINIARKQTQEAVQHIPATTPTSPIAPIPVPEVATSSAPIASTVSDNYADTNKYAKITSPIMGTFYTASGPDMPNFAEIGSSIVAGSTVCIVEAMKIFNEIKSPVSGKVVAILKKKGDSVSVDEELFVIEKI